MPPAFVLSQDQTLHKLKFVYQIIWSKHYLFDLRLIMKFSRFTSHYSIFNQLLFIKKRMFYNISSISILSNWFLKIFYIFFSFSFALIKLNFVSLWFGAFYNIEPIYCFCKSISKLFFKVFWIALSLIKSALCCRADLFSRRKTRHNISSRFIFSSSILIFSSIFYSARFSDPLISLINRKHIQ